MFVKSTSVAAASCAMLALVLTQQSATAGQQHARRHHAIISYCHLRDSNAYAVPGNYAVESNQWQSLANGAMASGIAGH
jgi:hypothetical protein